MADNKKKRKVPSKALEKVAAPPRAPQTPPPADPAWPRAYLDRTRSIIEERARRQAKADQQAKKALLNLAKEAEADASEAVETRIESWRGQLKHNSFSKRLDKGGERLIALVDGWLDRVGLVRKSTLA